MQVAHSSLGNSPSFVHKCLPSVAPSLSPGPSVSTACPTFVVPSHSCSHHSTPQHLSLGNSPSFVHKYLLSLSQSPRYPSVSTAPHAVITPSRLHTQHPLPPIIPSGMPASVHTPYRLPIFSANSMASPYQPFTSLFTKFRAVPSTPSPVVHTPTQAGDYHAFISPPITVSHHGTKIFP